MFLKRHNNKRRFQLHLTILRIFAHDYSGIIANQVSYKVILSMLENLRATLYHNRRDVIMFILLMIAGILIFHPIMIRWQVMGDYTTHNQLALNLLDNPADFFRNTPHFLYHVATAIVYKIIPNRDINIAAAWVMILSYLGIIGLIYWQLRKKSNLPATILITGIIGLLSLALAVIMPINFFTPENLYFGYLVPHVYHNPTVNIMKPFSILLFFMSLQLFFNRKPLSRWWIILFAFVTFLSLVAKPSFIIAFVPTLGLVTLVLMLRRLQDIPAIIRQPMTIFRAFFYTNEKTASTLPRMLNPTYINWAVLIGGIVLPTFAVLMYQTLTWTSSGGIGIDPFRVLFEWTLHYEENADKQLLYKFIMSCAFPLAVYLLNIREASRNFMLNLAWLFFFVSASYLYLFVDYTVIAAGDFGWSAQIAALILFITTTIFMLKTYGEKFLAKELKALNWGVLLLSSAIFILHLVAGIHWYRLHMSQYMEELLYIWW